MVNDHRSVAMPTLQYSLGLLENAGRQNEMLWFFAPFVVCDGCQYAQLLVYVSVVQKSNQIPEMGVLYAYLGTVDMRCSAQLAKQNIACWMHAVPGDMQNT